MHYRLLFGHSSRKCWCTIFFLIVGGDSLCMDVLMVIQGKSCIWDAVEIIKQKLYSPFFLQGVAAHGPPLRIRGDHCVENVEVAWNMFNHPFRGPDRGSYITGPRLCTIKGLNAYGGMYMCPVFTFVSLFFFPDNIHMFCFHFIYKPQINACLKNFYGIVEQSSNKGSRK